MRTEANTIENPPPDAVIGALGPDAISTILASLPTALLVADKSTDLVRYANARACDVLGVSAEDLVGNPIAPAMASIAELSRMAEAAELDDQRASLAIDVPGGAQRHLGISLAEVSLEGGDLDAMLIVFQDIEAISRLRDERDRLLKLATVGEALPSILHELKNPLASVTSAVELLVEEAPPGPMRDDLHSVLTEVRRMKLGFEGIGIVNRELASCSNHAIDLALRNATQVFKARAARDGIALGCEVPNLPLLPVDDSVIRAVAFNLLNNALHACSVGDEICVAAQLDDDGRTLEVTVEDTGTGMTPETLAACTELFFSTKGSGSGIGLALCKRALEAGGGRLLIDSTLGAGTTVKARVPLTKHDEADDSRTQPRSER